MGIVSILNGLLFLFCFEEAQEVYNINLQMWFSINYLFFLHLKINI